MTATTRLSRRTALKLGATATALPLVHIRTAAAAGKLSLALWDHWVPTGNAALRAQVDAWAEGPVAEVVEILGGVISGLLQRARLGGETPMEITPWIRIAASW